jgi:hypothetical protein
MMLCKLIPSIALLGGASLLLADVQFEQTSKITGGSMVNLPFVGGKLKEPQITKHIYKGARMGTIAKEIVTVYDLDKDTITTIHKDKREYSVMTFAEMREAMDKAMEKMKQAMPQQQKNDAEMTWSVKVDDAGESKNVNGFNAKKFVVTVDGVTTDKKSGKTVGSRIETEQWMATDVPGADEMNAYGKRLAEKFGAGRVSGLNPMVQAQMGKGWYEAAKEFAKMQGFSVMTVTRMSSTIDGQIVMVPEGQQGSATGDAVKDAARDAAVSEGIGRVGRIGGIGGIGNAGLGGLRRGKKPEPASSSSGAMVPATTLEMTQDVTSISRSAPDAGEMQVPAGFKQVESEMKKLAK